MFGQDETKLLISCTGLDEPGGGPASLEISLELDFDAPFHAYGLDEELKFDWAPPGLVASITFNSSTFTERREWRQLGPGGLLFDITRLSAVISSVTEEGDTRRFIVVNGVGTPDNSFYVDTCYLIDIDDVTFLVKAKNTQKLSGYCIVTLLFSATDSGDVAPFVLCVPFDEAKRFTVELAQRCAAIESIFGGPQPHDDPPSRIL